MSAMFFTLTRVTPGAAISVGENPGIHQSVIILRRHRLGLTDEKGNPYPIPQQYVLYMGALLHGDLGDSYVYNRPVTTLLMQRLPNSILLLGAALLVALAIGDPARDLCSHPPVLQDGHDHLASLLCRRVHSELRAGPLSPDHLWSVLETVAPPLGFPAVWHAQRWRG